MGIFSSIKKSRGSDQSKEFTKEYELVATDDWLAELRPSEDDDDAIDFGADRRDASDLDGDHTAPSIWHMPDVGDAAGPSADHALTDDTDGGDDLQWDEPQAFTSVQDNIDEHRRPSIWEPPAPIHHDDHRDLDLWNQPTDSADTHDTVFNAPDWDTDQRDASEWDVDQHDDTDLAFNVGPLAVPQSDAAQTLLDVLGADAHEPWEQISRRHAEAVRYYTDADASDPQADQLRQSLNLSYAGLRLLASEQR